MKRVLVIIMILFSQNLAGQNYQNICTPGVTFFKNILDEYFHAFRPDSVVALPGQDTLFFSYRAIRDSSGPCLDTTNGSVFGRKVLRRAGSGQFLFFNHAGDTIVIQSAAELNQAWTMIHLPAGSFIEAKVTGIGIDSVLGTTDQVKTIICQAKNSAGVNISHPFNQCLITLSQHYGIVNFFEVYPSPESFQPVVLKGKQTPPIGIQFANAVDLFDFNIGDEFHYRGYYKNYNFSGGLTEWEEMKTIIAKTMYSDSVIYTVDRCRRETRTEPPFHIAIHDTLTDKYLFQDPFYNSLPDQFIHNSNVWYDTPSIGATEWFGGRNVKILVPSAYVGSPNCWTYSSGLGKDIHREEFSDRLGRTYFHHEMTIQMYTEEQNELVYFHQGNDIWGTPVATDCNTLVGYENRTSASVNSIRITPNPAQTNVTIKLTTECTQSGELKIFNILGKEMAKVPVLPLENQTNLNVIGWPRGVYVVISDDNNTKSATKLFVLN